MSQIIVTADNTFGPFNNVETLADRWLADGMELQFSVFGDGTVETVAMFTPSMSPEQAQAERDRLFNAIGQQAEGLIELIVDSYPVNERLTFSKQQLEADSWIANNASPTPFIDANVAQSGIDKATVVANIQRKSTEFSEYCGAVIGYKQKLIAQLSALPDDQLPTFDPLAGWPASGS
jgi:hypothetical protein